MKYLVFDSIVEIFLVVRKQTTILPNLVLKSLCFLAKGCTTSSKSSSLKNLSKRVSNNSLSLIIKGKLKSGHKNNLHYLNIRPI